MYQMPSTAICWSTYEFFKYILGNAQDIRIVAPSTNVLAEEKSCESKLSADPISPTHFEKISFKSRDSSNMPRELPAMSGNKYLACNYR